MHLLLDAHLLIWAMGSPQRLFSAASLVPPVADLPPVHCNPCDHLLLAQAKADSLLLITADQQLSHYPGPIRLMAAQPQ